MAKKLITTLTVIAIGLNLIIIAGCQNDAQTGAAVGTAAGAGIGQMAGGDTESTLIGAGVGGVIGYVVGNESDKQKAQTERDNLREETQYVTVNMTNSNGSISRVRLKKQGVGYIGTRGEYYNQLPTEDQLRPIYGF
jgi:hypothetical protein